MSALGKATEAEGGPERRHAELDALCSKLARIIRGRAAKELIDRGVPERAGIVLLPVWTWAGAKVNMGRKDLDARSGGRLLMPIRIEWSLPHERNGQLPALGSPVVLTGSDTLEVNWRARGAGHRMAGQAKIVHVQSGGILAEPDGIPSLADPVFTRTGTRGQATEILHRLVADGTEAQWDIVCGLEKHVERQIINAHAAVCREVAASPDAVRAVLDETGRQQVLNRMMFGEDDQHHGSVFRMIDLCLAPGRFVKVDPLMYMTTHLKRDAQAEIRRSLGDPHIGPKIREIARRYPDADIARVVEEYRKVYPGDRLAADRAEAALSVQPDLMAASVYLSPELEETLAVLR